MIKRCRKLDLGFHRPQHHRRPSGAGPMTVTGSARIATNSTVFRPPRWACWRAAQPTERRLGAAVSLGARQSPQHRQRWQGRAMQRHIPYTQERRNRLYRPNIQPW